jgi:hypothetical protein
MKKEDELLYLIGKLYTNLQSLEYLLRGALYEIASPPHNPLKYGEDINSFKIGDRLPENALTDYSTLGQLINRFNSEIAKNDKTLFINSDIITLRDALAHGRCSSNLIDNCFTLVKFDKPINSNVNLTFLQKLTSEWLNEKSNLVYTEAEKVIRASGLKKL